MSLLTAYWRFRADEVRTISNEMEHTKNKAVLASVAEDFERIAKLFEDGTLKLQRSPAGRSFPELHLIGDESRNGIVPLQRAHDWLFTAS
jgi:hypothetical protein